MAPPALSGPVSKKGKLSVEKNSAYTAGRRTSRSHSRDASIKAESPGLAADTTAKSITEIAASLKSDLSGIKGLVTCSICDQLLYEPWTLSCGHTYCYSCLCNWFVPNRHKKTCPECRADIKKMPAPAFIIKQMVEIFTKQTELMPPDESVEQHKAKRLEEMADVERDKTGNVGLFKGVFPENRAELRYDASDGVFRCSFCGNEHEGGPQCVSCGAEIDDEDIGGFSDMDGDADLVDHLVDLDDSDIGHDDMHYGHFGPHVDMFGMDNSEDDDDDSDEDDDDSSLQDFVVQDESDIHNMRDEVAAGTMRNPLSLDSEDESDEGGAVSNRRFGRRQARVNARRISARSTSPSEVSSVSVTDSTDSSEIGDYNDEATMLRNAGWSPLDQGNDSDAEQNIPSRYGYAGYAESEDGQVTADEGSDTETIGHGALEDEDDDRSRDSETPHYEAPYQVDMPVYGMRAHPFGYADGYPSDDTDEEEGEEEEESIAGLSTMDQDGDTEMSVSPGITRASSHVSIDEELPSRGSSVVSDGYDYGRGEYGQHLGAANEMREVEEESSDSSIRPMTRRRPRNHYPVASSTPAPVFQYGPPPPAPYEFMQPPDYNPRLSSMFAEHQQRVAHAQGFDGLDPGGWRVEIATSRDRRRTPSYQTLPSRRQDPLRSHRSPSVTRVVSLERAGRTGRAGRTYRQYLRN